MEEKAQQFKALSESIRQKDVKQDLMRVDPEPLKLTIKND
jgi:hypothetical protein